MRIAVVGPQNTGKSTFIKDVIAAHPEFKTPAYTYRDAIKEAGLEKQINQNTNLNSQTIILDAVIEEVKRSMHTGNVIHDRCPLDAWAYTKWPQKYKKNQTDITISALNKMRVLAEEHMSSFDLIFYIPRDESIPFEPDNFRDIDPKYQEQMGKIYNRIFTNLKLTSKPFLKYGYKVVVIEGSREERVARFENYIKTLKG